MINVFRVGGSGWWFCSPPSPWAGLRGPGRASPSGFRWLAGESGPARAHLLSDHRLCRIM